MSKLSLFFILSLLARIVPHAPNYSAYMSLIMLMGYSLSLRQTLSITLLSLISSDLLLAALNQHTILGLWSIFTYSGLLTIAYAAHSLHHRLNIMRIVTFAGGTNLAYWLWTNLGTWLSSSLYPHTSAGLTTCFIAGLPFLQNSLISAMIFLPLGFGFMLLMERTWASSTH